VSLPAESVQPVVPAIDAPLGAESSASPRVVSLDAFRGLTIAGMILVNNPGSWTDVYGPLTHAEWNGWTLADLIFPFFLFIMGVAITVSLAGSSARGAELRQVLPRIIRRTLLLVLCGLVLNALMDVGGFATLRIPGVLQRIALCYLTSSLLFLTTGPRSQVATLVGLLAGYWLLLEVVPVPGKVAGSLDPEHNLAAYLDRRLLGERHLYHETWDPEGLLSTLPSVATALFGVLAGHWLLGERDPVRTTLGLVAAGTWALAVGEITSFWLPINKNLWTSSYAVFTAGVALLLFALCYWLVDVKKMRRPVYPLVIFGVNSIAVYVLSMAVGELLDRVTLHGENLRMRICQVLFNSWATPEAASLLFAAAYVLVWLGVMELFYRKRIFIKI